MATASIEVSGLNAERVAGELRGVLVTVLDDGTQVDLSGVDLEQLEIVIDRRTQPRY